ncbi:hypothetical protein E3P91_00145 [Wallemia ichthyophaga]|nr:hypothetical protein E3P91_00145 [Wallemia ichthyophaga]
MSVDPAKLDALPKAKAEQLILSQLPDVPPVSQLSGFFFLNLLAIPLLIILALTIICSKRIHRHPVSWIFFFAMAFSSFCYSFLIWAGEPRNKHPSDNVRVASAVLAIISPTVEGGVTLALVVKVWTVLVDLVEPRYVRPIAKLFSYDPFLLSFTWIITFPILIYAAVVASDNVRWVQRLHFYCTILPQKNDIHVTAMLISMIELALTIIFSIWSSILYFSVSRTLRRKGSSEINADLIFRVMTFTCWIIMTLVISAIEYSTRTIHVPLAILVSTNPIAAFFIFASQRDMLKVWGIGSLARYFNCTQSTDYTGSSDRRSSRAITNLTNEREMDEVDVDPSSRKEFSKLSSVDDFHNSEYDIDVERSDREIDRQLDAKDPDIYGGLDRGEEGEGEDEVQVVHKRASQGNHGTHGRGQNERYIPSRGHSDDQNHTQTAEVNEIGEITSPFATPVHTPTDTPTYTPSSPATSLTHGQASSAGHTDTVMGHKRESSILHRKPVPSFASYELPPVPSPTSATSASASAYRPALNRNGSRGAGATGASSGPLQQQQQRAHSLAHRHAKKSQHIQADAHRRAHTPDLIQHSPPRSPVHSNTQTHNPHSQPPE